MQPESINLGKELARLLRRWHWLSAAILLGGFAGWITGLALPPGYEAEARLSVSFTADAVYLTPDDYKNWQLAQLEDFILGPAVLDDTLAKLSPETRLSRADLRARLDPRWRNAGSWQLVASAPDPHAAAAIAEAWRAAALDGIADALDHAVEFNRIDRRLDARARELAQTRSRLDELGAARQAVEAALLGGQADHDLWASRPLAERVDSLLGESGNSPENLDFDRDPLEWFKAAAGALESELATQQALLGAQLEQYDQLGDAWLEERRLSRGFSAYLLVEMGSPPGVSVELEYDSLWLSLAGAAAGLFGFIGYRLITAAVKGEDPDGER